MNFLLTMVISFIFSLFVIIGKKKHNKFALIAGIIIFIGCFVRLYRIDSFPLGLNQDEASIGYEAYSLVNYGVDRFGMSWPVHFVAWGSGQNALYAYFILPIINILGNNSLSIRLPMTLIGCLSIIFVYFFIRRIMPNNNGLIVLFIFAVMPWHIMKSRWGLESNIFPDLVLYALVFMYFGIVDNKKRLLILSSITLGISTYAYGTSYLFIPILLISMYVYLVKIKKISFKQAIIYFSITAIIALPMILFVIINYFKLDTINMFGISIPRLPYNRFTTVTSVNGNFIKNCFKNFIDFLYIIIFQKDAVALNYMNGFGVFYLFSLPLFVYGIIVYFKRYYENIYLKIIFIALICSFVVGIMIDGNINRLNITWFPMLAFIILGVIDMSKRNRYLKIGICTCYLISFILFNYYYFGSYQRKIASVNNYGLEESILSINTAKNIYITDTINQPYIFWLYYTKMSPNYYIKNRSIENEYVMFQQVKSIDKIKFYLPNSLDKDSIYIVPKELVNMYDISQCVINNYYNYYVLDC